MHRSREIAAGVVIVLALVVGFLLLLGRRSELPASRTGRAGFVTTSPNTVKPPGAPSRVPQGQGTSETARTAPLPAFSTATLRRGADPRFPARLDLLVLDSSTRLPIPGVRVTAMNRATEETVAEHVLPEGRGTVDLPTAALLLTFEHPEYQERRLWIEFNSAAGQNSRETIELRREVQVSGIVRDQNGNLVSGATILFPGWSRPRDGQIVSGTDGRFNCRLPPGQVSGAAFKGGNSVNFTSQIAASATAILNITLPITIPTISFAGRILNQKGEPVEGAVIRVGADPRLADFRYSQRTEEDGTFAFSLPPTVSGTVSITAAGAEALVERVPLSADLHRDFVIDSHPAFTVTLLTPEGKAVAKGFRVEGVGASISKVFRLPDGRYYSTAYPVEIRAFAAELGYGNSEVIRLSAYEPEVTLRMEPGGNLRGRAVDSSGQPISRFSYLLLQERKLYLSQSLIDSPDGSFSVKHVTPGRYTLRVIAGSYPVHEREIVIEAGRDCFVEIVMR